MEILITLVSILTLTGAVWLFNRVFKTLICPICAGVSLTWLWLLVAMWLGVIPYSQFVIPAALLMGGSVVGIAYQSAPHRPPSLTKFTWLTWLVLAGFGLAYGLLTLSWMIIGASGLLGLGLLLYGLLSRPQAKEGRTFLSPAKQSQAKTAQELEKELEECC